MQPLSPERMTQTPPPSALNAYPYPYPYPYFQQTLAPPAYNTHPYPYPQIPTHHGLPPLPQCGHNLLHPYPYTYPYPYPHAPPHPCYAQQLPQTHNHHHHHKPPVFKPPFDTDEPVDLSEFDLQHHRDFLEDDDRERREKRRHPQHKRGSYMDKISEYKVIKRDGDSVVIQDLTLQRGTGYSNHDRVPVPGETHRMLALGSSDAFLVDNHTKNALPYSFNHPRRLNDFFHQEPDLAEDEEYEYASLGNGRYERIKVGKVTTDYVTGRNDQLERDEDTTYDFFSGTGKRHQRMAPVDTSAQDQEADDWYRKHSSVFMEEKDVKANIQRRLGVDYLYKAKDHAVQAMMKESEGESDELVGAARTEWWERLHREADERQTTWASYQDTNIASNPATISSLAIAESLRDK